MLVRDLVRPLVSPLVRGIADGIGSDPTLAFHALNFGAAGSPDVSVGVGALTEGRTSTIYRPDDSGIWQPFASGVPGKVYANGKWWLYGGPAGTNELPWSRDLTNAAWSVAGGASAAFDAVGLTGAASTASTVTDDDVGVADFINATITVANDSLTHTWRVFIKKDTDETRFLEIQPQLNGGTPQFLALGINTKTGATAVRGETGTTAFEINQVGDWWEVLLSLANNTSGNTIATIVIFPAAGTIIGVTNVVATGTVIVGNAELHLNKTIEQVRGSTPIFTAGSTVTVNAVDPSFDDANHADLEGAYFVEFKNVGLNGTNTGGLIGLGTDGRIIHTTDAAALKSFDGTTVASSGAVTLAADDTEYKIGIAYGDSLIRINVNGAWGTAVAYDGSYNNAESKLNVLHDNVTTGDPVAVMLMRNLRRYDLPYVAAQAKIDQLMA